MEETIELRELVAILLKGKWIIAVTTVAAILCAFVISWFVLEDEYQATATIEIAKLSANDENDKLKQLVLSELSAESFKKSFTDNPILEEGMKQQDFANFNIGSLAITQQPNTTTFNVSYTALNADEASKYLQLAIDSALQSVEATINEALRKFENEYSQKTDAISNELRKALTAYNELITANDLSSTLLMQPLTYDGAFTISDSQANLMSSTNVETQLKIVELMGEMTALKNQYVDMKELQNAAMIGMESIDLAAYIKVENSEANEPTVLAPNKKLNLAIGAVLGLMLGVGIVLFLDYWRKSTKSI